ncbi:copper chaperone PCu(A)C [Pseudoteredinibacter isoporae]|uniref:copper chaperone PCu(A)C n=1 Tax=Pseudoteredinibacter isoporae TaxID=570281 RepID=UPI0031096EEF
MGFFLKICRFFTLSMLLALAGPVSALEQLGEAYSRPLPPGQSTAVAYLELRNDGDKPIRLISVSSPLARSAEFHRHIHEDGMMKMRKLSGIDLGLGKILRFQPGGYHIMLFGVKRPLRVGDTFTMQIETDTGESLDVDVRVKAY